MTRIARELGTEKVPDLLGEKLTALQKNIKQG